MTSRPSAQLGGVHLGDRGGGQRHFLESAQVRVERRAVGALDAGARHRARERRHVVLQLGQLVGDVVGQQVASRGQGLAELDEDRSELLEREPQPLGARAGASRR